MGGIEKIANNISSIKNITVLLRKYHGIDVKAIGEKTINYEVMKVHKLQKV